MWPRVRLLIGGVPLLLLLIVLLAWGRSYLPGDHTYVRVHNGRLLFFFAAGDTIALFDLQGDRVEMSTPDALSYAQRVASVQGLPVHERWGFASVGVRPGSDMLSVIAIPFWALAAPLAVASGWWLVTLRRRAERLAPGRCRCCGYDMRGSGEVCPECGTRADAGSHVSALPPTKAPLHRSPTRIAS